MARPKKTKAVAERSLENPSTPITADWLEGSPATSGIRVNHQSALTYAAVWRAVNLISKDVAKLPLFVYRRVGSGKEIDRSHPAFRLLHNKPNAEMTSYVFRETLQAHVLLLGNAYAYIFRDGAGNPTELIPLCPDYTYPIRVDGRLMYVTEINSEMIRLQPTDVLHIKGLGYDGLQGYSVIEKAKESIGLGLGARKYGSIYFQNNARPGMAIMVPAGMKPDALAKLKTSWHELQGGLSNAHKVALLTEGMDIKTYGSSAKEAQLNELRMFELREIANWFGVPPHKVGDTTRTAFASLEQENQSYLDSALDPWLCSWEEELEDKLLRQEEQDQDTHLVEFLRAAVVRVDLAARGQYYSTALQNGWMSRNEVRSLENMPAMPELDGYTIQVNMQTLGQEPAPQPDQGQQQASLKRALRRSLTDALKRAVKRLSLHVSRAAKKPEAFLASLDSLTEHKRVISEMVGPSVDAIVALGGQKPDLADKLLTYYRTELLDLAGQCQPAELNTRVTGWIEAVQQNLPKQLIKGIL